MATYRYVWNRYIYQVTNVVHEQLSGWPGINLGDGWNSADGVNGHVWKVANNWSSSSNYPATSYYGEDAILRWQDLTGTDQVSEYFGIPSSPAFGNGQIDSSPYIPAGTYFGCANNYTYGDDGNPISPDNIEGTFVFSNKTYAQTLADPPLEYEYDDYGSQWLEPISVSDSFLYYAVTDIIVDSDGGYHDPDTGDNYYERQYVSGTVAFVRGTVSKVSTGIKTTTSNTKPSNDRATYELSSSYTLEPSSVSISTSPIKANSSATIVVSGGKSGVSYTYQYSANGGSWTTIASTSTTSYNFTVPTGTTSLQVRVLPYDSLGSGSAVTSSTYTVISSVTYTSVSGVIKTLTPKVCVGGGYGTVLSPSAKTELSKQAKARQYISRSSRCLKKGA